MRHVSFWRRKPIFTTEPTGVSAAPQLNNEHFSRHRFLCSKKFKRQKSLCCTWNLGHENDPSATATPSQSNWHWVESVLQVKMCPADSAVFKEGRHRNGDYNYVTRGSVSDLHVFELMGCEGHLAALVSELQAQQALTQLAARLPVCANKWAASLLLSAAQYLHCPSSLVTYELIQHI